MRGRNPPDHAPIHRCLWLAGFLGNEAAFSAKFGKALRSARAAGRGSQEAQAGLLAMEGLHKQVGQRSGKLCTLRRHARTLRWLKHQMHVAGRDELAGASFAGCVSSESAGLPAVGPALPA